eukprot:TRINITY_DN628_c0_g1_i1.p1 TRINITY_DN628_c0_g1~~TRINITY_DN628_c0_g1_i1.p1  ORF type:complete len:168 (+),score=4.87 TRINITY_DN628_c0_g1_i1:512-1015(+)
MNNVSTDSSAELSSCGDAPTPTNQTPTVAFCIQHVRHKLLNLSSLISANAAKRYRQRYLIHHGPSCFTVSRCAQSIHSTHHMVWRTICRLHVSLYGRSVFANHKYVHNGCVRGPIGRGAAYLPHELHTPSRHVNCEILFKLYLTKQFRKHVIVGALHITGYRVLGSC